MNRADAYAKLVEHCDELIRNFQRGQSSLALNRKTRRLIRALLVERAKQARTAYYANASRPHSSEADTVLAAVLRRPQTGRGK